MSRFVDALAFAIVTVASLTLMALLAFSLYLMWPVSLVFPILAAVFWAAGRVIDR